MAGRIFAACKFCGTEYKLKPSAAGKRARCKHCREFFLVPLQSTTLDDTVLRWLLEDEARDIRDREQQTSPEFQC